MSEPDFPASSLHIVGDARIKEGQSPWRWDVLPSSFYSKEAEAERGQCPAQGQVW